MEGAGDLDLSGGDTFLIEELDRGFNGGRVPRDDDLIGCVLVGQDDPIDAGERGLYLVLCSAHRGHRASVFSGGAEDRVGASLREL